MIRTLKLYEFDKKPLNSRLDDQNIFILTPNEIDKIERLNDEIKKRDHLSSDVLSFNYRLGKAYEISTTSYVGVLKINNKVIQIMPKMARIGTNSSEHNKEAIKNLLYMLSYTKKMKISETSIATLSKTNDDFFEILINLFAKNLLLVIQNDLYKQYITKEENLAFIKGKLQMTDHIKQNVASRHMFYTQYDDFNEDNLLNRILKYTVYLLINTTKNVDNLRMLQKLNAIFNDVALETMSIEEINKLPFTRLNIAYEPIINLCKVFIGKSSLKLFPHNIDTFSFMLDMNVLFEEFIGEFIRKELSNFYEKITLQKPVRHLVDEKVKNGESTYNIFQMKPDIQFFDNEKKNPYLIVDTKYKILDFNDNRREGVSQADLYQMFAYAKKFGCKDIILLYPKLQEHEIIDTKFIIENETNVYIKTVDLCKDLKLYKEEFKKELIRILFPKYTLVY